MASHRPISTEPEEKVEKHIKRSKRKCHGTKTKIRNWN
jgi:hypothetical protein